MKAVFSKKMPIGNVSITEEENFITSLSFNKNLYGIEEKETDIIKEAFYQLEKYLLGELQEFNIPLKPQGTDFMNMVWQRLIEIPYGKTKTYKQIAQEVGNPKACRAVGLANNKNPIAIFIPCHRVIGTNNKLIGYAGGLEIKKYLLNLENKNAR